MVFDRDEQRVSIRYHGREWAFYRPVLSPWNYETKDSVYWVAPGGDDRGPGTSERPLQTIREAIARASAGDIIYVRAGTYAESLVLTRSGEKGRPIILSCAPGDLGKVTVTPPKEYVARDLSGTVVLLKGACHVWINGLVIEGPKGRPEAPDSETYGANGITWAGKAGPGCRATNNVIHGNVHCGIKEMHHGGSGMLVEANIIFDNGTNTRDHGIYMPADDVTMNGNIIFGNTGFGIHSYEPPRHQVITRNICFDNGAGGIILAGSENRVFHNIATGNAVGMFYFRKGCKNNEVKDNIFAGNRTDCGYDNGGGKLGDPSDNDDDYNCYFPGRPDARLSPGAHEVLADPRFRDARKDDFRLRAGSPCPGKGAYSDPPSEGKRAKPGGF